MSQAFVRENDEQWLHEVPPTVAALLVYLTRENNGIRVCEQKRIADAAGREIYVMSNGLSYTIGNNGTWEVV